jgi:hypothetical protein
VDTAEFRSALRTLWQPRGRQVVNGRTHLSIREKIASSCGFPQRRSRSSTKGIAYISPISAPTSATLRALIHSPIKLQNAITHLQNRSLVAYQHTSQFPTKRSRAYGEIDFTINIACNAFLQIQNPFLPESWPQCELLVPHIQSLTSKPETSRTAKIQLLSANRRCEQYLEGCGRYVEAEELYRKVIADREQLFNTEELNTMGVMFDLVWVFA